MWKRCTLTMLLVTCAAAPSALAAGLVLLGTNQSAALTAFPALHTLKAFEGRIYMGYGDWNQYPAVVVTSYQPDDGSFHLEFSAYTDSIGIFREIGGKLYVPSTDPVHFQDFHDLSYRSGGVWRDHTPVGMYHVFDVATVTGDDLWITGAKSVNDTTNDNAAVFRSLDGGRTWEDKTIQSSQFRYYWGFPLRGNFYVRDTVYTNGVGTRVTPSPYEQLFKPFKVGDGDSQFVVGLAQRTPGFVLTAPQTLVTYDTTTWRNLRSNVWDFTLNGSIIFTLERNGTNQLWRGPSVTPTQAVWQSLGFTNVPSNARSVEVMGDVIYVGDAQGRLWSGRLDGSELAAPTSTVVNELSDDFGKGLAIDGNVVAVGAPDHSGCNYLCGQVTIWENLPTEAESNQWRRTAVIDPPQPSFSGWFGKDVAVKDDVLVVAETGSDLTGNNRGRLSRWHLYQRTSEGWSLRLTTNHFYIHSVATDGDSVVVGSSTQMFLYQLSRNSNNVLSATPAGGVQFGNLSGFIYEPSVKVAMESNTFVAALSGDVSRYGGPGEVRVYEKIPSGAMLLTNVLQQTWTAPPRGATIKPDRFGFSIALKNGWLAVGAPRDDSAAMQSGAVYLYQRTILTNGALSFVLQQVIYSPNMQVEAGFGSSVALTDSRLIVGSPGTEVNGQRHHGSAYVYQLAASNWIQIGQIAPPPNSTGEFGSRVAVGSNWMAVASRFSDPSTNIEARIAPLPHLAPYDLWTSFHGLAGSDAAESSDLDGDGVNNLVEYACNLDPRSADAVPVAGDKGLPAAQLARVGNESYLEVMQVRRRNSAFLGLNYTLETSEDLENWSPRDEQPSAVLQLNGEWERIGYRFPILADQNQLFCRIRVQLTEAE